MMFLMTAAIVAAAPMYGPLNEESVPARPSVEAAPAEGSHRAFSSSALEWRLKLYENQDNFRLTINQDMAVRRFATAYHGDTRGWKTSAGFGLVFKTSLNR